MRTLKKSRILKKLFLIQYSTNKTVNLKEYQILAKRNSKVKRMSKKTYRGWCKVLLGDTIPTKFDSLHNSKLYPTYTCKEYLEAFSKPE